MKQVTVRYTVMFEATIEVPDNATPEVIGEELANLNIPEDENSKYVEDTFEPVTDDDGNPKVYGPDDDIGPFYEGFSPDDLPSGDSSITTNRNY